MLQKTVSLRKVGLGEDKVAEVLIFSFHAIFPQAVVPARLLVPYIRELGTGWRA